MGVARRLRLLGKFEVEGVETSALGSRKGRTLLKRLAIDAGSPVSVDSLVDILWPDEDKPAKPAEQVSVLVSRLRRALGQDAIGFVDGAYTFSADWIDVAELRARVDEATRRLGDGSAAQSRAASSAALALVRGPLLAEDPDEAWTQEARASAARLISRARHVAAEGALAGGLGIDAAEHASAALSADPYDEAALRLLMRAHVAAGRPALALAAYAETATLVADELGVDLDAQTQALHVEVLHSDGTPPAPRASDIGERLAGRARELDALDSCLDRVRRSPAVVVVLEGEAGIGKSRVLTAFAESAAGSAEILRASAESIGVLPMQPILEMLGRWFATASDDDRAEVLGAESDLLAPLLLPGVAGDSTAYRDVLVGYEPGEQSAPAVLHVAVLAVVARLSARRPVVMILDDAHRADGATLSWLSFVALHGSVMPLLVVAARRPSDHAIPGVDTIVLERLDPEVAAAIVAPFVAPERLAAVVERSAGLPLFLVELAHADAEELPDSIRESVAARIADAGPAAATLHAAAVLGAEVDADLLATVLEMPTPDLLDHLDEGARRRILQDASTGYVFHHDLIRESLDAATGSARRAWLHRQAAHVLARRVPVDQMRVAHHARLGGDQPLAASALSAAAEQAGARFDHDAALALADESLQLADSADARLFRARSFVLLRRYAEARAEAERALALGAGGPALEVAAFAAYYARDLDAVLRLADEAAAVSTDQEVLDTCSYLAAKVLHTRGDITQAEQRLQPMIENPTRSRMATFSRTWMTLVHLHRGHVDAAARDLAGSESARLAPVPYAALYISQFEAHVAALEGRPLDAIAAAERLRDAAAQQNAARFFGRGEVYRGWALSMLCTPTAVEALETARDVSRSAGNPEPLGQSTLDLAAWHLDHEEVELAIRLLDEVDDVLSAGKQVSNGWRIAMRAGYLRGRVAIATGQVDHALEQAVLTGGLALHHRMDRYHVLAALLRLEAEATAGEPVDIRDVRGLLPQLVSVARPEAWRVSARIGRLIDSDELRNWSSERVEELVANAAPYLADVRGDARRLLDPDR